MENIRVPVVGTVSGLDLAQAVNTGFDSLQQNIGGALSKSVAGGSDVTLSAAEANYGIIVLTGALTANINVIVPTASMQWTFRNSTTGAYTVTVKTSGGTGVPVKQGSQSPLFCDGVNVLMSGLSMAQAQTQAATAFPSAGTAPAYTLTADPAIGALAANQRFRVKFHSASTGAATLAVNGLAATGIKQYDSTGAKVDPAIAASQLADVEYDGTHWVILDPLPPAASAAGIFYKKDSQSVAFTKTAAGTLDVKAGTVIDVLGVTLNLAAATAVVMPALSAGTDYAIYACQDGTVRADSSFAAPTGYTAANSRKIGGFNYAPGGLATGTSGGDSTPQILAGTLWDLYFRPACPDPRGMKCVGNGFWIDLWPLNTEHITNGTSKYGATIADGASPPKIPLAYGGNGSNSYGGLNWWQAAEVMQSHGKRLPTYAERAAAGYGVTEGTSRGADPVTCQLDIARTSAHMFMATGNMWEWGNEFGGGAAAAGYVATPSGRGSTYQQENAVIFAGSWGVAGDSGSLCANWYNGPANSSISISARGVCAHLNHG